MTDLFQDVNLAQFGLEDNGTPIIDQNSSIEAGGGTETGGNVKYFTRDELLKAVAENGLTDENGDLSEQGRTYLLNDQSFLDSYTTPEQQDAFFAAFNKKEPVPVSTEDNGAEFNLDFGNLIKGGDLNTGKSTDNAPATVSTDKGESTLIHADGDSVKEPNDPDTAEVAPQEQPSLEDFFNIHIALEDVSVPLNADGSVPSNINTQMAVLPVNDPTKPKTLSELYQDMDLEPAPSVTDETTRLTVDEAVNINTKTNGILASTGFDLSTATEDLAAGDDPHVTAHINALQDINVALRDRENQAVDILNTLIENNGVDRETAQQLETLKTGIITTRYSLESFGRYPTQFGLKESMEAADAVKFGAMAAAGAVLFGMLIKIILWIRDKLKLTKIVTEANREAVRKVTQSLNSELIRIERDYSDDLSKNDAFKKNYVAMAKKYSLRANFGSTSLLEVNDGIRTYVVHANLSKRYNKIMQMMIEGDKIQELTSSLVAAIQGVVPSVEKNVHDLLNKFSGANEIDVDQYKIDFKFIETLEKTVGVTSNGTEAERVTYFNDKLKQLLQPTSGAATPTFNKLIEFKLDINSAYAFDDKYEKSLTKMLGDLTKLKKQAESITDKAISDNRKECISVVKDQAMAIMQLTSNLIAIRDSAGILLKGGSGATKEAIKAWTDLFQGTGITFKPNA